LRQFLIDAAERFGDTRQVTDVQTKSEAEMEELLHRMIVARPDLKDLHRASRQWLFHHGIDTFGESGERRN
jgi:predicted ATPase